MNVDVVVPVFNGARFVRRAVESARTQRFPDGGAPSVTIWCVDDASTDETLAVLEELADQHPEVRIVRHAENRGVAAARNTAVRAGAAEFIAFLDQDDAWLPDKLARQLAALREHPEAGYSVGLQRIELDAGAHRPAWCRPEWLTEPQAGFIPSALVVRRSAFAEVGELDETFRAGGDDSDWFAQARRLGVECIALEEVVFVRYVHDSNGSRHAATSDDLLALVRRHLSGAGSGP